MKTRFKPPKLHTSYDRTTVALPAATTADHNSEQGLSGGAALFVIACLGLLPIFLDKLESSSQRKKRLR